MNKNSVEMLIENMGKDIDEKIRKEIKENNKKIVNNVMLFMQIIIVIAVGFLEFYR